MSTTELFKKHFGDDCCAVGIFNPNVENFFDELNKECIAEREREIDNGRARTFWPENE